MTYFTYETARIVAHLQNDANEALKERIRCRLEEAIHCPDITSRQNREDFESFCWAWSRHALMPGSGIAKWAVDPYPFVELARWREAFRHDETITETPRWLRHHEREDDIVF